MSTGLALLIAVLFSAAACYLLARAQALALAFLAEQHRELGGDSQ